MIVAWADTFPSGTRGACFSLNASHPIAFYGERTEHTEQMQLTCPGTAAAAGAQFARSSSRCVIEFKSEGSELLTLVQAAHSPPRGGCTSAAGCDYYYYAALYRVSNGQPPTLWRCPHNKNTLSQVMVAPSVVGGWRPQWLFCRALLLPKDLDF